MNMLTLTGAGWLPLAAHRSVGWVSGLPADHADHAQRLALYVLARRAVRVGTRYTAHTRGLAAACGLTAAEARDVLDALAQPTPERPALVRLVTAPPHRRGKTQPRQRREAASVELLVTDAPDTALQLLDTWGPLVDLGESTHRPGVLSVCELLLLTVLGFAVSLTPDRPAVPDHSHLAAWCGMTLDEVAEARAGLVSLVPLDPPC